MGAVHWWMGRHHRWGRRTGHLSRLWLRRMWRWRWSGGVDHRRRGMVQGLMVEMMTMYGHRLDAVRGVGQRLISDLLLAIAGHLVVVHFRAATGRRRPLVALIGQRRVAIAIAM